MLRGRRESSPHAAEHLRTGAVPKVAAPVSNVAPRSRLSQAALLIGPKAALLRALERAFGDPARATRFVNATLREIGLNDVPTGELEFEGFVRDQVLARLVAIVPLDKVHEVVRRVLGAEGDMHAAPLRPHGSMSSAEHRAAGRPRVVIVEEGDLARVRAQALIASGFDVETLGHAARLLTVEPFHVVVMALDADGEDLALALADARTRAGLVTFDDRAHRDAIKRVIDRWPNDRVAVAPANASAAVLCGRVRAVIQ